MSCFALLLYAICNAWFGEVESDGKEGKYV